MARDAGIPVWIGGMLESSVGGAVCVELATLDNVTYPGDLFPSSRFYTRDLAAPPLEYDAPHTFRPFGSDLPAPDPEMLAAWTRRHAAVTAEAANDEHRTGRCRSVGCNRRMTFNATGTWSWRASCRLSTTTA